MSSQFRLRRAVEADVPAISDIYFKAFDGTIICQKCFPPALQSSHEWMQNFLAEGIKGEAAHVWVVVDDSVSSKGDDGDDGDDDNGYVVAFAKWVGPKKGGVPMDDEGSKDPCPPNGDVELAREFFGGMHKAHLEIMGKEQHWFLSLIGTRPETQGKGAAGMLIRWGLEQADIAGLRVFLDATPMGKPIYQKFGFKEVRRVVFNNGNITQDCMIREISMKD